MIEPAGTATPQRSGFPGAPAVEHQDRGVVETGERVGADGVREMMIHEAKFWRGGPKAWAKRDFRLRADATGW